MSDETTQAAPAATTAPAEASAPATPAPSVTTQPAPAESPELVSLRAEHARMQRTLQTHAEDALAAAPEATRRAIVDLAGDDPAKRLEVLAALRRAGLTAGPPPVGTTTAPTQSSPAPTSPGVDPDAVALAEYERLGKAAPTIAAAYRRTHADAIKRDESRKASPRN